MPQILQDLLFVVIVAVLFTAPLYWISRPKRAAKTTGANESAALMASQAQRQAD